MLYSLNMEIQHILVNEGLSARCNRFLSDKSMISNCKELIKSAIFGETVEIPYPPYQLKASVDQRQLMATIFGRPGGALATFAVAPKQDDIAVWDDLMQLYKKVYNENTPPEVEPTQAPCLATVVMPTMMFNIEAQSWLHEFLVCFAWAWIDYLHEINY